MLRRFLRKNISFLTAAILFLGSLSPALALGGIDRISDFAAEIKKAGEKSPTVTIMVAGDLMCQRLQQHTAFDGQTYDFTPTFKYVKNIFDEADYVVGNLETMISKSFPLVADMTYVQGRASLNAPSEYLDALKYAGFDALVTANNHCCDLGPVGITETIDALNEKGFDHTGIFSHPADQRYILTDIDGFKVGILSYAKYFNEKEEFLTEDQRSYMINPIDEDAVKKDIQDLRNAGAEFVIVYSHCGTEYSQGPSLRQKKYAQMYADAGADYVVGSHPHVLQRAGEVYSGNKRVPILFSMGNFASSMGGHGDVTKETIVLSITLRRTLAGDVVFKEHTYYPCYILDEYDGCEFVIMPESDEHNGDYEPDKTVEAAFSHIKKIMGTKYI
ncbi:MAG: CapA family protein [Oscillospiraceae bacterium]|nr:CapA family protein [Oscillospiraceae bacterium]